jgi:hypothetical protein
MRGTPVPQWALEEPETPPMASFYIRAFWELSTERQIGLAIGPIPVSKIRECAQDRGVRDVAEFLAIIQALDRAYLQWVSEQRKQKQDDG